MRKWSCELPPHFNLGTSAATAAATVTLTTHPSDDGLLITGLDGNVNASSSDVVILINTTADVTSAELLFVLPQCDKRIYM